MCKLRVHGFSISIDGYGAGTNQGLANPIGDGGLALHQWAFGTRTFQKMIGQPGGATGLDDDFMARGIANIGAWVIGRNMFGPVRGPWPDDSWKGWWGGNPPFHAPVFVLTHHPRPSLTMEGGTVFHFVTDGMAAALNCAREAAKGQGRSPGWGSCHDPAVPCLGAHRRYPFGHFPHPAGFRRKPIGRHRRAKTRLSLRRARLDSDRYSRHPQKTQWIAYCLAIPVPCTVQK